jgi:hypothetical protein
MRARVFIDFWNFQLGWNDATSKAKCSWSTLPTVLVKEAGKLLAATGDTTGLVLDETIEHASVEDAKEACSFPGMPTMFPPGVRPESGTQGRQRRLVFKGPRATAGVLGELRPGQPDP